MDMWKGIKPCKEMHVKIAGFYNESVKNRFVVEMTWRLTKSLEISILIVIINRSLCYYNRTTSWCRRTNDLKLAYRLLWGIFQIVLNPFLRLDRNLRRSVWHSLKVGLRTVLLRWQMRLRTVVSYSKENFSFKWELPACLFPSTKKEVQHNGPFSFEWKALIWIGDARHVRREWRCFVSFKDWCSLLPQS